MRKFNVSISVVTLKVLFFIYSTFIIATPAAVAWEILGLPYYTSTLVNITPFDWTCLFYGSIGIIAVLISFWTGNDDTSQGIIKRDGFPATAVLIGSSCMLLIGIIRLLIQVILLKF